MAIFSLYRASATLPGTPDPAYAQAQRQRQAHPQIQPEQQQQHPQPQHIQRPTSEFSSSLSPLLGLPTADFARFQDRPASPVGRLSPAPGLRRRDSDTPRPPADLESRARGRSGSISYASGTSAGVFPRVYADERVSAGSVNTSVTATTTGEDDVPLSTLRRGEVVLSSSPYTSSPRLGAEERRIRTEVPGSPRGNGHGDYPPPPPRLKREDGLAVSGLGRENKLLRRWCGLHNQKAFLLFLLYTTALSGFVGEETGYAVYKWLDGGQVQDITDFRPVANLLLFLVAVTFFLAIGSFLAFHLYLASNNRTTLENLRPSLPPAALIEPASATPLLGRRNSASPTSSRTSSPDRTGGSRSPTFVDPPPAYTPLSAPTTGARHSRLHKIQLEFSPRLNLAQTPTSFTATGVEDPPWRWQWRWKSDHLLTRNERKTARWVAENANIYDLGNAWSNLVGVLDGSGMDTERQADEMGKDLEAGGGEVTRRGGVSMGRCLRWFWPGETVTTAREESRTALPPGHDFPISQRAIDLIRHKTYGLRSRRQVPIRPARIPDGENGGMTVRSSNEYEFESEDGYEEDEVGWAV
ncbi:hypothetical protein QFC21_003017 [Naganishia friedmannii]|uniref:Uncharacterized protein n=1 Tax=Naganishia friedmannii TaxID=89922 RepID=A0ACC2VQH6_9TREE|nr:hypothetical protein QFC21_003017 [Naganishia friedmannii]